MEPGYYERVLPAYAGMILLDHNTFGVFHCAPRVCGDDPHGLQPVAVIMSCSPRMRG